MSSKPTAPSIPIDKVLSWEDWLKGRRQRRELGNRVARKIIRRRRSSKDPALRRVFAGKRGLPFAPDEAL